jgi:hypothetical protein
MGKVPKSAYEIALEKLKRQDQERGEKPPATLNERQKKAIAEIRSKYDARLAEREILFKAEREKVMADPDVLEKIEEEYARERRHLEEQRDREITAVRAGRKTGEAS